MTQIEGHINNANGVKELVLERLREDKVITEAQENEYAEKWQIIIVKPSWFKRWMRKFNKDADDYLFKYVKFED